MRKTVLLFPFLLTALFVFPQTAAGPRLPVVGVLPFEASGDGVSANDAGEASGLIVTELSSWGTMVILQGDNAKTAEYLIQGQVSRTTPSAGSPSTAPAAAQGNQITVTVTTSDGKSGKILTTAVITADTLSAIAVEPFCDKITENVPFPNYLLGVWRSTITMPDGPVTCIMEFRSDRTLRVRQYDTWESSGTNTLKYQAIGNGTYTYAGYRRRVVTVNNQQMQADATVGINLTLEDALPKYTTVSRSGLRVLFDDAKVNFELINAGLPCGDNYTGPSVYPGTSVFYTKFAKIQ